MTISEDLETANEDMEIDLHLRIGLDTGGPVSGRILDTDKPVFDLYGETVNTALQIQGESSIGIIKIGARTYDRLDRGRFVIDGGSPIIDPRTQKMIETYDVREMT